MSTSPPNPAEVLFRSWYELKFSFEFRRKCGSAFQDFFASIMERRYPGDFQKVKPYGNRGDLKCDGYQASLKRVYQAYAPEKMDVSNTNTKIEKDLQGAIDHWGANLKSWVFVHNQPEGLPADVVQKLLDVDGRDGVKVSRMGEAELRNEFFGLDHELQALLLGPDLTPQTMNAIQLKDVKEVANAIAQEDTPPPEEIREVPAGKLKANVLSEYVQDQLRLGSRKSRLVGSFFSKWHDPELGDRVAKAFRSKYEEVRAQGMVGDAVFFELWKFAGGGAQSSLRHEAAVVAVLAFLFEECDVFETPALKD